MVFSGGFWVVGFLWYIIEIGMGGVFGFFVGYGEVLMLLVEVGLFVVVILFGVWFVVFKVWLFVWRLLFDMNLLMVVVVVGVIGFGEFFEVVMVVFFFLFLFYFESWSVGCVRNVVLVFLDFVLLMVCVICEDGSEVDVLVV